MAFCKNCGTELYENEKFCRACGTPVDTTVDVGEKFKEMSSTTDSTALFDATDIAHNKALAMQSYLGILVLFSISIASSRARVFFIDFSSFLIVGSLHRRPDD